MDKKYNLLLSGGTGFFGKNILWVLRSDVKLTILSRNPDRFVSDAPKAIKNFNELIERHEVSFIKSDIRLYE